MKLISIIDLEKCGLINPIYEVDMLEISPEEMYNESIKMAEFCVEKKGIGLSAVQVGVPEKFFVYTKHGSGGEFFLVINPIYYPKGSRYQVDEACLSYPGKVYRMKRFRSIRVDYWTVEYNKEMKEYMYKQVLGIMKGDDALTFQHEVDHGNGKTIAMSIRERRNR